MRGKGRDGEVEDPREQETERSKKERQDCAVEADRQRRARAERDEEHIP